MGNGKKTFAKVAAMLMAATSLFSTVGCDLGGDDHSDETYIMIENFGGGVGVQWLNNAIRRFMDHIGDKQYEEGKPVVIEVVRNDTGVHCDNIQSSGSHMFFFQEPYSKLYNLIQVDAFMEITDIVRDEPLTEYGENVTIESKMDARYRFAMQGTGNFADKYYMLPGHESMSAASYDMDLFETKGFYLAQEGSTFDFDSTLLGRKFYYTDLAEEKTVGNDGIAGTDDDGMPTTLDEMVAMCEYIKFNGVAPFSAPGGHIDYANHLLESLSTALAGYDQRAAVTTLSGEVDWVTGISDEELWAGTGIKRPVIERASISMETGYKAVNQASRYYAFAFMELAQKQGWFYDQYTNPDYNHKAAMRSFVLNGLGNYAEIASHVEGTYWYNEAESYGLFNDYKTYSGGKTIKNIGYWHMPTAIGKDTDGNGTFDAPADVVTGTDNKREEVAINNYTSSAVINGNIDDRPGNEGKVELCKDFLQFLYTEKELKLYTATTGVSKALMDYPIDGEVLGELDPYQQTVMRLRDNNRVVQQYGNNNLYRNFSTAFVYSVSGPRYAPTIGTTEYSSILEVFAKRSDQNAWTMFIHLGETDGTWAEKLGQI